MDEQLGRWWWWLMMMWWLVWGEDEEEDGLQLWEWSQGGQRSLQFLSQWGSASRKPEPATSVSWPASLGELSANISFGADQRATRAPISSQARLQSENNSKQTSRASGGDPLDPKQCKCSQLCKVYPQSQKQALKILLQLGWHPGVTHSTKGN